MPHITIKVVLHCVSQMFVSSFVYASGSLRSCSVWIRLKTIYIFLVTLYIIITIPNYWTNFDNLMGRWIETPARKSVGIFFPAGWFDASLMLVTKQQSVQLDVAELMFSWARPFSFSLWCLVVVTWIFAGVIYWIVEDGDLDGDGKDRNMAEFAYTRNWQNLLVSILNTALEFAGAKWHTPKTFAGRVFALGWLFARLLLISSYTANLATCNWPRILSPSYEI